MLFFINIDNGIFLYFGTRFRILVYDRKFVVILRRLRSAVFQLLAADDADRLTKRLADDVRYNGIIALDRLFSDAL